ncbi:Fur family transcriptional regulator [Actinomadura sp. HBU206391]|uniref:Fur family transcriptional regulator n=1 Tax=Actinomadura sp. HBU206391 TaxID=2731692 RepID=UPI001650C898|nr:Fur family transcriptional regulator [Actinomadura sp. HBU206391]MBC6460348.1 transcriptional repressor [Actinomadura sp. HBU206391]
MAETWQEELRARGYRVTPQRQLVLEAVTDLEHATPEEICTQVQRTAHGVNISTVYRTLELLEELGLVKHAHLGHGPPTYHLAAEAEHVHLVCRRCGTVTDVTPRVADGLVELLRDQFGFETDVHHLTVHGCCGDCEGPASGRS